MHSVYCHWFTFDVPPKITIETMCKLQTAQTLSLSSNFVVRVATSTRQSVRVHPITDRNKYVPSQSFHSNFPETNLCGTTRRPYTARDRRIHVPGSLYKFLLVQQIQNEKQISLWQPLAVQNCYFEFHSNMFNRVQFHQLSNKRDGQLATDHTILQQFSVVYSQKCFFVSKFYVFENEILDEFHIEIECRTAIAAAIYEMQMKKLKQSDLAMYDQEFKHNLYTEITNYINSTDGSQQESEHNYSLHSWNDKPLQLTSSFSRIHFSVRIDG